MPLHLLGWYHFDDTFHFHSYFKTYKEHNRAYNHNSLSISTYDFMPFLAFLLFYFPVIYVQLNLMQ